MSRCYGCCQENCGYTGCTCGCHSTSYQKLYNPTNIMAPKTHYLDKCPCKKHKRYQAKRKPTSGCEECWRFYVKVNP